MNNVNMQLHKHRKFRTDNKKLTLLFFVLAILVAAIVFWWLKLVGITITGDAFCGMKEHTHTGSCYTHECICGFLVCGESTTTVTIATAEVTTTTPSTTTETTAEDTTTTPSTTTETTAEDTTTTSAATTETTAEDTTTTSAVTTETTAEGTTTTSAATTETTAEGTTTTSSTTTETTAEVTTTTSSTTTETTAEDTTTTSAATTETTAEVTTTTTAAPHVHTEACYQKVLVCQTEEHVHTPQCFPDKTADVETVSDWLATIEDVEITNDIPTNLINIARSQLGYTESVNNYEFDGNGARHGYTRYGEWYGTVYGPWDATFVSFCLHYSNVSYVDSLKAAGSEAMRLAWKNRLLYSTAEEYTPERGDLVFIDLDDDADADIVSIVQTVGDTNLIVIAGDSNDMVEVKQVEIDSHIMGYGRTGDLGYAEDMSEQPETQPTTSAPEQPVANIRHPLMMSGAPAAEIVYTSDLTDELLEVRITNHDGKVMADGDTMHIGEPYTFELRFKEINQGSVWTQFHPDENTGYLTYTLPENMDCTNVNEWLSITAKTPNGDIKDVGQYCIDENDVLLVEFFKTSNGENFLDLYTNVDFTVEFSAVIPVENIGEGTKIEFNEDLDITLLPDGGGTVHVTKTPGDYDAETGTVEYTIRVEAAHGMIKELVLNDDIQETHRALRDTIVVTDLKGNLLDPQPIIGDHPESYLNRGFQLTGFPDFVTGEGFLITYKSQIDANQLNNDTVGLWNGAYAKGKTYDGSLADEYAQVWHVQEIKKIKKEGKQAFVTDENGNIVPAIEWDIIVRKHDQDLAGTIIIDTLGEGLTYYTGSPIIITCYNENGNFLNEVQLKWDQVTIEGEKMTFDLPEGYSFVISYYTTYTGLAEGEEKTFSNKATAIINGNGEETTENTEGFTDVIGIVPHVTKKASGNDGNYVKFTISAKVPAIINGWGHFYLTDDMSTWNNIINEFLYVENVPEDLVVTAKTVSGKEIIFTPFDGGSPENTYTLITPAEQAHGTTYYGFRLLFNTAETSTETSKWLLDEDATLTISYRIPFTAITGHEWTGPLTGTKTLGDVLMEEGLLSNQAFFNYAEKLLVEAPTTYEYNPKLTKNGIVNADGTIDYTVIFNNDDHDTDTGYLNAKTLSSYFHDVFDEKMEYVPGSMSVTCYPTGNSATWLNVYKYMGDIQGNEMHIPAEEFVYGTTHPDYAGWLDLYNYKNLEEFYSNISKGTFVFTYTLKLKDEYLYTTDYNLLEIDNTAEVTWDETGTTGPATEQLAYKTGLLDKQLAREEDQLYFTVHVNRLGLDMDVNADTITVEDTMTENISVYWDTIQLYYRDANGDWINFLDENSQHTHLVTFDQHTNKLSFIIPDALPVKIEYTTLVTETGLVSVHNTVTVSGKDQVTDYTDAIFRVDGQSGSASGSMHSITLMKEDGDTDMPLSDVKFYLYGPKGDPKATVPAGQPASIVTEDGKTLKYIGVFTTGEDGTTPIKNQYLTEGGPYALVEHAPPPGYIAMDKPTYFYFYQPDPDGIIQTVTTIIAVDNYPYDYVLPETGGTGTLPFGIIGITCMAIPIVYSIIRRKRERRYHTPLP